MIASDQRTTWNGQQADHRSHRKELLGAAAGGSILVMEALRRRRRRRRDAQDLAHRAVAEGSRRIRGGLKLARGTASQVAKETTGAGAEAGRRATAATSDALSVAAERLREGSWERWFLVGAVAWVLVRLNDRRQLRKLNDALATLASRPRVARAPA